MSVYSVYSTIPLSLVVVFLCTFTIWKKNAIPMLPAVISASSSDPVAPLSENARFRLGQGGTLALSLELTSRNPFMKLSGRRSAPRKFSVLKYAMTWVVCFQKFIISYATKSAVATSAGQPVSVRNLTWAGKGTAWRPSLRPEKQLD